MRGKRYGRLIVRSYCGPISGGDKAWLCHCDCGHDVVVRGNNLRRGMTVSCGCVRKALLTKHGRTETPEHHIWRGMWARCLGKNKANRKRYFLRGITVCDSWKDFNNFFRDLGPRPFPTATLDRINNDLGYSPENCRWATRREQTQNRHNTRFHIFRGERLTLRQIMTKTGCPLAFNVVSSRIWDGWNVEDAVTYPLRKFRPSGTRGCSKLSGSL